MVLFADQKMQGFKYSPHKNKSRYGSDPKRAHLGFVGEAMARHHLGLPLDHTFNDYDYDFLYRCLRYEVKSIGSEGCPLPRYNACINHRDGEPPNYQKTDRYIFTRVRKDTEDTGWLLGWIDASEFKDICRPLAKGSYINPKIHMKNAASSNVYIRELYPIDDLTATDPGPEPWKQLELFK